MKSTMCPSSLVPIVALEPASDMWSSCPMIHRSGSAWSSTIARSSKSIWIRKLVSSINCAAWSRQGILKASEVLACPLPRKIIDVIFFPLKHGSTQLLGLIVQSPVGVVKLWGRENVPTKYQIWTHPNVGVDQRPSQCHVTLSYAQVRAFMFITPCITFSTNMCMV